METPTLPGLAESIQIICLKITKELENPNLGGLASICSESAVLTTRLHRFRKESHPDAGQLFGRQIEFAAMFDATLTHCGVTYCKIIEAIARMRLSGSEKSEARMVSAVKEDDLKKVLVQIREMRTALALIPLSLYVQSPDSITQSPQSAMLENISRAMKNLQNLGLGAISSRSAKGKRKDGADLTTLLPPLVPSILQSEMLGTSSPIQVKIVKSDPTTTDQHNSSTKLELRENPSLPIARKASSLLEYPEPTRTEPGTENTSLSMENDEKDTGKPKFLRKCSLGGFVKRSPGTFYIVDTRPVIRNPDHKKEVLESRNRYSTHRTPGDLVTPEEVRELLALIHERFRSDWIRMDYGVQNKWCEYYSEVAAKLSLRIGRGILSMDDPCYFESRENYERFHEIVEKMSLSQSARQELGIGKFNANFCLSVGLLGCFSNDERRSGELIRSMVGFNPFH